MKRVQQVGKALGSDVSVTLLAASEETLTSVFRAVWSTITQFEKRFSRFIEDSELSVFNQHAGQKVAVSQGFFELLSVARELGVTTSGLYNPFVLPSLQRAGYTGSWPNPTSVSQSLDFRAREVLSDVTAIKLGEGWAQIPVNTAIEFGGIGKGFLLDKLSQQLDQVSVDNYWVSLGGDIVCRGFNLEHAPWQVGIAKADAPDKLLETVVNEDGEKLAIATSGITKRRGTGWHHIIDPRTGNPAKTDLLTATVCARKAAEADVLAKCLIITGQRSAPAFAKKQPILRMILQAKTKETVR